MGPSYSLRWERDRLLYVGRGRAYELDREWVIAPSEESWARFWRALDRIGAWDWQGEYERAALDGTHWSISIGHGGRVIEAHGSNGYPGSDDPDPSREFRRFLAAVRALIGNLSFA